MSAQQKLLIDHFRKLGAKVQQQKFRLRHPADGHAMTMTNLIVEWNPQARERILLCTHYDTRPFPDQDRVNPRGKFVVRNDGASGTALLMALAQPTCRRSKGSWGSTSCCSTARSSCSTRPAIRTFSAQNTSPRSTPTTRTNPRSATAGECCWTWWPMPTCRSIRTGISLTWDDTRPLVEEIWNTAKRLKVREFVSNRRFDVNDDHVRLHDIGGISCCDIIDFKYPAWHTQGDLPDRCSALSLAKVGWVISEWLKQAVKLLTGAGGNTMDPFSACVAFGPLAMYSLLLGAINLSPALGGERSARDAGPGPGVSGLVTVGPMQLFMPLEAAVQFGRYVWLLLIGFYALSLTLAIILSRPRLVVYNISTDQFRPLLEQTVQRLDPDATFAGAAVNMPLTRIQFHVENFPPLANLSLLATGDEQSISGWRRLERRWRNAPRMPITSQPHGFWLVASGIVILAMLAFWVAEDPQTIAHGINRMLNP